MFLKNTYPALFWALFIAILCGVPGRDIPHISFLELLEFDKLVHASVFFVLVYLLIKSFQKKDSPVVLSRYPLLIAVSFSIAYGALLEILQGVIFIERSADVFDFIANSFGCVMAAVFIRSRSKRLPQ